MAENRFNKYGLNNELEIKSVALDGKSEIINKKTIEDATLVGLNKIDKENPEEKNRLEQIVTVLENIRAAMENIVDKDSESVCSIAKTAVNTILVKNDLEPIDEDGNIEVTKENISSSINALKHFLK